MSEKNAIVLAMFGTTAESALPGLISILDEYRQAFPATPIRIAFTSNIIRRVWQKRAADPHYRQQFPHIPDDIFSVQGQLAAIAGLQDRGYRSIVVQAVHMAPAEEFHDLGSCVRALAGIRTMKPHWRPFERIVVGRPILGAYSQSFPYGEDIRAAAEALREDADQAIAEDAALVYMGHGNPLFPTGGLYLELQSRMNSLYPQIPIFIGTVEGYPSLDDILPVLHGGNRKKVHLKPLLITAGAHALKDMAGHGETSWLSRLRGAGFDVTPVLRGLGEQTPFIRLLIDHTIQAAADAGIELRRDE